MRYHQIQESDQPSNSDRTDTDVKLVFRLMPAVYRWLDLDIREGKPEAVISMEGANVGFLDPFTDDGSLSTECRGFVIAAVRDEVERHGRSICIVFGVKDAVYVWPGGKIEVSAEPPSGGLRVQPT